MDAKVRMNHAQIIGRSHLIVGKNSQDAVSFGSLEIEGRWFHYAVICDGCSEGKNSEVGAKLASSYIGRQIEILLKSKVDAKRIPWVLHKRTIEFLKQLLGKISFDSSISRVNYIKDNLLFTVLGFVRTDNEIVIFAQGDGVVVVNDEVFVRDEKDMPRYIGYSVVEKKFLSPEASELPENFDVNVFQTENVSRFAIASDSLGNELQVVPNLWGNEKEFSLQKKVNVWSIYEHKFADDLTIVTLEKISEGGPNASLSTG